VHKPKGALIHYALFCRPALIWCAGRVTNLYLCCQSAAGVTLSPVAFKAVSGFILLASTFDGRYSTSKLPSLEDWGRCGELNVTLLHLRATIRSCLFENAGSLHVWLLFYQQTAKPGRLGQVRHMAHVMCCVHAKHMLVQVTECSIRCVSCCSAGC
jgi:hypothetical protein